ncbi:MAG: hypothetical protein OEW04_15445 [Nitrospirota bacterium]|nr:hypothetical protein [Nitrospirota bacterium]
MRAVLLYGSPTDWFSAYREKNVLEQGENVLPADESDNASSCDEKIDIFPDKVMEREAARTCAPQAER